MQVNTIGIENHTQGSFRTYCCVAFRGIGIGRCGSNADLLKQLFTPHVVMVSSVSIIVIVMVTVGLSYYCYKLKTENRIEPSEDVENNQVDLENNFEFSGGT